MNPYKIIFLDIDGTIITPDNKVQESTKKAIQLMQQKGMDVVLATGRPLHEVNYLAGELNVDSMIGYNGAYGIYKGENIWKKPASVPFVEHFLDVATKHDHELVLFTKDKSLWNNIDYPRSIEFMEKFHIKKNEHFEPSFTDKILSLNVITNKENDFEMYEAFGGVRLARVNIQLEEIEFCYDVVREIASKGKAVKAFLEQLDIPRERAIAFGDAMNDKEMLTNVEESFAMGNADPQLFKYAKHKTTSVEDSGVYNGLKSLGLIR